MRLPAALLDASALLALVFKEKGANRVWDVVRRGAAISAVNAAEVASRLGSEGWTEEEVEGFFEDSRIEVFPFDRPAALLSGAYRQSARQLGLSLGDRACLATARQLGLAALTADRAWAELELDGVSVICIR
ncbi:MAG: type II toxin-antitoxin system VapC family toxin [Gemmatimonadales bacterium]|nr:type II toxin-antitoxin system VapC family toxin [Gemmatimonadales bacterium]MXX79003.1 type II toxin-antitoxin system VapC family toxin [Gemmatimonadales bacterium]MYC89722.1 type II toxin-antitoxin system VapC family toxin [Candidatus Palauibacter denitrificans]